MDQGGQRDPFRHDRDHAARLNRRSTNALRNKAARLRPDRLIKGMSERLIVSHYQNNYGGAVQRLNAITKELAELDFSSAPIFVINGLKREELIAMNSMILHEIFFA